MRKPERERCQRTGSQNKNEGKFPKRPVFVRDGAVIATTTRKKGRMTRNTGEKGQRRQMEVKETRKAISMGFASSGKQKTQNVNKVAHRTGDQKDEKKYVLQKDCELGVGIELRASSRNQHPRCRLVSFIHKSAEF